MLCASVTRREEFGMLVRRVLRPIIAVALMLCACLTPKEAARVDRCEQITATETDYQACLHGNFPPRTPQATKTRKPKKKAPEVVLKNLAVLPLDAHTAAALVNAKVRATFEDSLRGAATSALASPEWTVLGSDETLAGFTQQDVKPDKCRDQDCQLSVAKGLKADAVIVGAVQLRGHSLTATFSLIDASGKELSSLQIEGKNAKALQSALDEKVGDLLSQSGLVKSAAPPAEQAEAPVPPPEDQPSPLRRVIQRNDQSDENPPTP